MPLRTVLGFTIFLALVACGNTPSLPQKPQLITDRDSLGFGQEFGSGTYIGTSTQNSLMIENQGLDPLVLNQVTIAGDSAFVLDPASSTTIKAKARAFLRITFTPTQAKVYTATITIDSNAENTPHKTVDVTGKGIVGGDGG